MGLFHKSRLSRARKLRQRGAEHSGARAATARVGTSGTSYDRALTTSSRYEWSLATTSNRRAIAEPGHERRRGGAVLHRQTSCPNTRRDRADLPPADRSTSRTAHALSLDGCDRPRGVVVRPHDAARRMIASSKRCHRLRRAVRITPSPCGRNPSVQLGPEPSARDSLLHRG